MAEERKREVWQRGPIEGVPSLLQPVAHALLQAREEVYEYAANFPVTKLWERPAGAASVGFHLQHLTGVLDRLFTYATGESLTAEQLQSLAAEGKEDENITMEILLQNFNHQVDKAVQQLKATDEASLTEQRYLGRAKIPTTVIGLLFHAAEHTMRHVGQLLVTVKILSVQ
jgi:uncharacterized damage-inducible protein DinB